VSMSVNDLKTKGYIDITESEKDKRYLIYRLTDKAEELCEMINASHFTKCETLFSGFTEEEKDAFRILAKRISNNIDDFLEDKL
ncbi:MAG: winged helix DNA-binding protein, partial [Lachnospiraceae bacterium]|nr:winged helix DNA-binding protein [Lachnospiraceae bacterium]